MGSTTSIFKKSALNSALSAFAFFFLVISNTAWAARSGCESSSNRYVHSVDDLIHHFRGHAQSLVLLADKLPEADPRFKFNELHPQSGLTFGEIIKKKLAIHDIAKWNIDPQFLQRHGFQPGDPRIIDLLCAGFGLSISDLKEQNTPEARKLLSQIERARDLTNEVDEREGVHFYQQLGMMDSKGHVLPGQQQWIDKIEAAEHIIDITHRKGDPIAVLDEGLNNPSAKFYFKDERDFVAYLKLRKSFEANRPYYLSYYPKEWMAKARSDFAKIPPDSLGIVQSTKQKPHTPSRTCAGGFAALAHH